MKKTRVLLTLLCTVALAGSLQAQTVVWQDDYEGYTAGEDKFGWGGDAIANYSITTAAGVGVGGSQGLQWLFDTTAAYSGYMAANMGYFGSNPSGNSSPNLSDYTLEFEIAAGNAATLNSLQLNIQGWAGDWAGAMTETGAGDVDVSSAVVGTGFHLISVNLGVFDGDASFDPSSQTYQIQWQVNAWQLDGGGPVTGQQVVIDNAKITMVPEPSTAALGGLGLLLVTLFRRRLA